MSKYRILDTFCGAGGAGMGYHLVGFEVVGVDIAPQKHYPFEFHQADALEYIAEHGQEFDAIHASPPCQGYSEETKKIYRGNHQKLIEPVRELIRRVNKPYVIENVDGARFELENPFVLCGSMFGLKIWRHRWFECPWMFALMPACNHGFIPVLITGTTRRKGVRRQDPPVALRRKAIGIDWMVISELDEAIPPAYTRFIGEQLRDYLDAR